MSTEDNKTIIRRIAEAFNQGDLAVRDELYTPDFVYHDPANPTVQSREDYKQWLTRFRAAFSDAHLSLEEMLAEEDRVAYRATLRALHSGSRRGVAPTGKPITLILMTFYHLTDGKIAEMWQISDALGALQQLGVIPAPEQVSESPL